MDLVYTVNSAASFKSHNTCEWLRDSRSLCAISCRNTVAFTSTTDIEDGSGRHWQTHVYVADLNSPWSNYLVTVHPDEVTCLEWDVSGGKLLFADTSGGVQIFAMRDYLLNEWMQYASACFAGERFLRAAWLHCGKKLVLSAEKKDSSLYSEKYTNPKFSPSIRHFGGRPREGVIAVSSTGMVCVMVLGMADGACITSSELLGMPRNRLKLVDLCYGKNGDFLVAASDGSVPSIVQCYQVTLRLNDEKCAVTCQTLPSFYPTCGAVENDEVSVFRLTHLRFVVREASDAVVVCLAGNRESCVELWELHERQLPLHKTFQTDQAETKPLKTVLWQRNSAEYRTPAAVVALTTPRSTIQESSPAPSYILAAYSDSTIKCFYRESLQLVCSVTSGSWASGGLGSSRGGSSITDLQLTWSGSGLAAVDSMSQLYLYRLSPVTDPGGPMSVSYGVALLEFCLISGWDWWDILLCLKPSMIEAICDKLIENFDRQPATVQQYWQSRFLTLKISLYRCSPSLQAKAADTFAIVILSAVSTLFKSLLRPTDVSIGQDKGPAESLSSLLATKPMSETTDVDKILLSFERNKEFCVEPATLQSLQPLIQWVADYCLYLLAILPAHYQGGSPGQVVGCGVLSDLKALNCLREMLLMIRMWGLIRQTCLPVFNKTCDNLDILSLIFKLITKLIVCNGQEMDENLIDECCLLSGQVLTPAPLLTVTARGVSSPALAKHLLPLSFEFGVEPEACQQHNQQSSPSLSVEGCLTSTQKYDVVRQVFMGQAPPAYKQCTRCCSVSLVRVLPKSAATKAWEQRWMRMCPCGGQWACPRL